MFNWSFVGFATVAAVSLVTMDYYVKSAKAGVGFGELGVTAYVGSFADQYADFKASKEREKELDALAQRQRLGARPYLPDAPDGWQRRAYLAGDNSAIEPQAREISDEEKELIADIQASPTSKLLGLQVATSANRFDYRDQQGWVYERDGATVYIGAVLKQPASKKGITGRAMAVAFNNMNGMASYDGFAIVQGVPFTRVSKFIQDADSATSYETFKGFIGLGQEVQITIVANAPLEDVRALMEHIDFAGLNGLLAKPWPDIGPDAPEYPALQQIILSEQAMKKRREILNRQSDDMMSDLASSSPLKLALGQVFSGGEIVQDEKEANQAILKEQPAETAPAEPEQKASLGSKLRTWGAGMTAQKEEKAKVTRHECKMVGGAKRCRLVTE